VGPSTPAPFPAFGRKRPEEGKEGAGLAPSFPILPLFGVEAAAAGRRRRRSKLRFMEGRLSPGLMIVK
jgi:hypothetical protein